VSQPDAPHLEPEQVAAMVDGTLAGEDRHRVVAHLADCASCRNEIAEVRAQQRAASQRVGLLWAGGAAAAILAGVLVTGPLFSRDTPDPVLRAPSTSRATIEIVSPADVLDLDAPAFTWHSLAPGTVYTLILMDESAEVVWRLDGVRDTTATVPGDRTLRRNAGYLFVIDARLPDGRTVTSGTRRLSTR